MLSNIKLKIERVLLLFEVDDGGDVLLGDVVQPTFHAAAVPHLGRHVLGVHLADVEQPLEARPEEVADLRDALLLESRVDDVAKLLPEQLVLTFAAGGR